MKSLILIAFIGSVLAVWTVAGMALWLVIGPWLLCRFLVNRLRIPSGDMG